VHRKKKPRKVFGAEMKKKALYFFLPALVGVCLALFPDTAGAQGYQSFRREFTLIEEETPWQIGPFHVFPRLLFTNVGYDDNIYRLPENREPIGDYTFTISLPVAAHLLLRERFILSLNYNPSYVFYAQETRERAFNHNFSPRFRWLIFNRLVLTGSYLYRHARMRANSESDFRTYETRQNVQGQLVYETGRRTSLGFSVLYSMRRYEDIELPGETIPYSVALNRDERSVQGELYYQIWTDSQLFIEAGFGDIAFINKETQWKDSYTYYIYPGIQFPILGRLRGTLSLGYKILDPYRAKKKGFSGFVGRTGLEYELRRFTFRGGYQRDTVISFWTNNVFYIEDRINLGLSFYMSQRIRLDYDFYYGDAFYPEMEIIRLPDETYEYVNRSDQYRTHTAGFVIRIFRSAGIGITATYWERNSNFNNLNRNRSFIGGFLTYEF